MENKTPNHESNKGYANLGINKGEVSNLEIRGVTGSQPSSPKNGVNPSPGKPDTISQISTPAPPPKKK